VSARPNLRTDVIAFQQASGADVDTGDEPSSVYLNIRTAVAGRLVKGRPRSDGKPAILGLLGFADRLRLVWDEANKTDPFARWWLCKVERAILESDSYLQADRAEMAKRIGDTGSLSLDPGAGRTCERIPLRFTCPYAYWAARLVGDLDELIIKLDLATRLGIELKSASARTRQAAERAIRRCFCSVQGYAAYGVTDSALADAQPSARDAEKALGKVPPAILSGDDWPTLLDRPNSPEARAT